MRRPDLKGRKGFTLIELMIVIAIIGILAAIAVPNFLKYRQKGYDSAAMADIKNAYSTSQAYFADYPAGTVTLPTLQNYGFRISAQVTVTVDTGAQNTLQLRASHSSGTKTYTIDSVGNISF